MTSVDIARWHTFLTELAQRSYRISRFEAELLAQRWLDSVEKPGESKPKPEAFRPPDRSLLRRIIR